MKVVMLFTVMMIVLFFVDMSQALSWIVQPLRQVTTNSRSLFLTTSYAWQYLNSLRNGPPPDAQPRILNPHKADVESEENRRYGQFPLLSAFSNNDGDQSISAVPQDAKGSAPKKQPPSSQWPLIPPPSHLSTLRQQQEYRDDLKRRLFAVCAGCDRGFAAVPIDRQEVDRIIQQLQQMNPTKNITRNFYPRSYSIEEETPLEGAWKMIYTSAYDVCALASNPLTIVQGVYQVISRDGSAVNVIDVAPRPQALLPPNLIGEGTTLRLKVHIRASALSDDRVGLNFRRVEVKPLKLFNRDVDALLPPISTPLPNLNFIFNFDAGTWLTTKQKKLLGKEDYSMEEKTSEQTIKRESPAYFDVLYLDGDTLIIKQAEPGGYFISVRSTEPASNF